MTVPTIPMAPNGPTVSRFIAGMWRLTEWRLSPHELLHYVQTCLDLGITSFDHADIYGSYTCEAMFGEALAQNPALRSHMQLITKCGIRLVSPQRPAHTFHDYDTSKAHIIASAERSLQNLRTDYLDVLLIHRPDPLMDADEVAAALSELKQSGKVLHFGVSNFAPHQFDLLASRLDFPLVTNQIEVSVMYLDLLHDGTVDQCQQRRIAPMIWSPLAGGRLFSSQEESAVRLRRVMADLSEQLGGATIDQIAFAWLLQHPANMLPILGTQNLDRVKTAIAALNIKLTRSQWFQLWSASTGTEVP